MQQRNQYIYILVEVFNNWTYSKAIGLPDMFLDGETIY